MEQLIRFNSDKLLNAQLNLNSAWEPHYKIIRIINKQTVESEFVKAQIQAKLIFPVINQNKLQQDIDLLINFFENLHVCIQHSICDSEVSHDLFSGYATYFFDLHRPWIELRREVIPRYACHLQAFVRSVC